MFRFWYKFIPDNLALIQNGLADRAYAKIEEELPAFMGKNFEAVCMQYMWRENAKERIPISFTDIGRWWGNDPLLKYQSKIDILAYSGYKAGIFGECKWFNQLIGQNIAEKIIKKACTFLMKPSFTIFLQKKDLPPIAKKLHRGKRVLN